MISRAIYKTNRVPHDLVDRLMNRTFVPGNAYRAQEMARAMEMPMPMAWDWE